MYRSAVLPNGTGVHGGFSGGLREASLPLLLEKAPTSPNTCDTRCRRVDQSELRVHGFEQREQPIAKPYGMDEASR